MGAGISNSSFSPNNLSQAPQSQANFSTFSHSTVTADWGVNNSTPKSQSATKNLYITSLTISGETDLTAEIAIQEIPLFVIVRDDTDSKLLWAGILSIPTNTHVNFITPVLLEKGHDWKTQVRLGGATNANITITIGNFESEY